MYGDDVAGLGGKVQHKLQSLDQIGDLADASRLGLPAVALPHPLGEGDARGASPPVRVAEVCRVGKLVQRRTDRRRNREVHVCDPRGQDVGRDPMPLGAPATAQPIPVQVVERSSSSAAGRRWTRPARSSGATMTSSTRFRHLTSPPGGRGRQGWSTVRPPWTTTGSPSCTTSGKLATGWRSQPSSSGCTARPTCGW